MDARDADARERAIVAGWQRGEEAAVRTLFEAYFPKAVRLAALSGLPADEAQDCAQEAFIRAFERRAQLRDPAAFAVWFHRIATSQILAALERHRRQPARAVPQEAAEDWPRDRSPQPDEVAVAAEERERLKRHVQALPPRQRVAIVLRYYEGHSTREVAEILGMRAGAARVTLHRAVRALREVAGRESTPLAAAPAPSVY
jgi:RNA polymerase sigma-70 factor (ECF subfamily)